MNFRIFLIGLLSLILLFGCQNPMKQEGQTPDQEQTIEPTRFGDDQGTMDRTDRMSRTRSNQRNQETRDHNRYDVAKEAADRIASEINDVDRAYVLTTNNNAYVAVVMNDDRREGQHTDRKNVQNNTNQGNLGNLGDNRNRANEKNSTQTDMTRRGTADNDLHNRTFIGRDDNISEELKRDIAEIVRSVDRNIDNVYVSTNPDFVDLTNNYIDDINTGRPIRGFFEEMGNMIERIFPQNR